MSGPLSKLQRYKLRKSALWTERSSWMKRYEDVSKLLLPYSGRFVTTDRNKGDRTFNSIYDETATFALDTLTAGLMAGMTSPARPWFRLGINDKHLEEYAPVRQWLADTADLMRKIYAKSNTYNALHSLYEELGAFATGVSIMEEDYDTVIHHTVLTAGEYAIATNSKGKVDTVCREFDMTVAQVVEKFVYGGDYAAQPDWSVVSPQIKNYWDTHKNLDAWITINHIIEPRTDRDTRKYDSKNMRFASCYFEAAGGNDQERLLRESGYKRFPALAPRWHTRGGDVYGNGPSFRAMGSIKQLQQEQLRKGQAIDYKVKPPLQIPAEQRNARINYLPGGSSYIPSTGQHKKVETLFDVNIDLNHLLADIVDVRDRVKKAFYSDLFLMISQDNRRERATAAEIAEAHEEKLLMLGPVLERLHGELLSPKIEMTFDTIVEVGILPPPPPELEGQDINIEFISTLAQAQKMVGIGGLDGFIGRVAQVSAGKQDPSVWDKVDADQCIDKYADMFGVDPSVVVADDRVVMVREDRAQQQAAQQRAAAVPAMAGAAKDLAAADTGGQNALTDVLSRLQGYNATV